MPAHPESRAGRGENPPGHLPMHLKVPKGIGTRFLTSLTAFCDELVAAMDKGGAAALASAKRSARFAAASLRPGCSGPASGRPGRG